MTLLALMYHRARSGPHGNAPAMLDAHFAHIARNYACVLPGEPLERERLNVCLTFDDAYYDFYAVVYPLLRQHRLRAVLAVSPVVIRDSHDADVPARLASEAPVENAPHCRGFCTWSELGEMAASDTVTIAAHGFSHTRLDAENADLTTEVAVPQTLLSARLEQPVDTFVFPYGRFNPRTLSLVQQHYRYAFRIGGASNRKWSSVLYRADADRMTSPTAPFARTRLVAQRARYFWNRVRGR